MVEAPALAQEKVMAVWLQLHRGRWWEMSRFKLHFGIDGLSEVSVLRGGKKKHPVNGKIAVL